MQIPQIQIRQQYAKINIQTTPAVLNISSSKAHIEIRQPNGEMEIKSKRALVEIDNYPMRYDMNMKNSLDFFKESAEYGQAIIMETIARYASQGDQLMSIEAKGNALMDVIEENSTPKEKQFALVRVRGPKFNVTPHDVQIKYTAHKPIIESQQIPGDFRYHRGKVDITLVQYPQIKFFVQGSLIDARV